MNKVTTLSTLRKELHINFLLLFIILIFIGFQLINIHKSIKELKDNLPIKYNVTTDLVVIKDRQDTYDVQVKEKNDKTIPVCIKENKPIIKKPIVKKDFNSFKKKG